MPALRAALFWWRDPTTFFRTHMRHIIKALNVQNHDNLGRTPNHSSSLVNHTFFSSLVMGVQGKRGLCAEDEAENVEFWWRLGFQLTQGPEQFLVNSSSSSLSPHFHSGVHNLSWQSCRNSKGEERARKWSLMSLNTRRRKIRGASCASKPVDGVRGRCLNFAGFPKKEKGRKLQEAVAAFLLITCQALFLAPN